MIWGSIIETGTKLLVGRCVLSFVEESELRWFVSVPELFVAFYLLLVGFKIVLLFIVALSLKL